MTPHTTRRFGGILLQRRTRRDGFTLMETLVSIGIFALGFVAVASVFPVGIVMQRNTIERAEANIFMDNLKTKIVQRGFDRNALQLSANSDGGLVGTFGGKSDQGTVRPVPRALREGMSANDLYLWDLADRSYGFESPVEQREMFWIPLFFAEDPEAVSIADRGYRVYLFVVRRTNNVYYSGDINDYGNAGGELFYQEEIDPTGEDVDGSTATADDDLPGVPRVRRLSCQFDDSVDELNTIELNDGDRLIEDRKQLLRIGDKVLAENGTIYTVKTIAADGRSFTVHGRLNFDVADPNDVDIWHAMPGLRLQDGSIDDTPTFVDLMMIQHTPSTPLVR